MCIFYLLAVPVLFVIASLVFVITEVLLPVILFGLVVAAIIFVVGSILDWLSDSSD